MKVTINETTNKAILTVNENTDKEETKSFDMKKYNVQSYIDSAVFVGLLKLDDIIFIK